MRPFRLVFLVLSFALFLAGCSVARFIPPLDIGDTLGLNNTLVDIEMRRITVSPGGHTQGISPLASEGRGQTEKPFTGDPSIDLQNFGVGTFTLDLGTDVIMRLTRPEDGFPEQFDLTDLSLQLEVIQEGGSPRASLSETFEGRATFRLDATSCDPNSEDEGELCRYRFDGTQSELNQTLVFNLEAQGARAEQLVQIIRQEGVHRVRITLEATTESTPELAGATLTVTLRYLASTIRLR